MVIATTHYEALKTYGATTEGVTAAAFGFTPDTFAPTYEIRYGSPGRSLALEMAARLGLHAGILDEARRHLTERETQLAEHLAKVDRDLRSLDHERRLLRREREALAEAGDRARAREEALRNREEAFRSRLNERLDQRLREARSEIDAAVAQVKRQAAALTQPTAAPAAPTTGDAGRLRAEARAAIDGIIDRHRQSDAPAAPAPSGGGETRIAAIGDRVLLPLGVEGVVVNVHDRDAEVDVRGKRFRAPIAELRIAAHAPAASRPAPVRVEVHLQQREGAAPSELRLVGSTVDEAIDKLEKFLDDSVLAELRTVRLIHGFGTGRLKDAVFDYLQRHPLVSHVRPATPQEGGGGVTIAELRDS